MFVVAELSNKFYGYEFENMEDEQDNINNLVVSRNVVIIGTNIDNIARSLNIDPMLIEIVD